MHGPGHTPMAIMRPREAFVPAHITHLVAGLRALLGSWSGCQKILAVANDWD